jgi:glycosyltransferase involved in cell wall biosynthesis
MRILWINCELLFPLDKGGKIRTCEMLKHLKRNHDVTYLTFTDPTQTPDAIELSSEYCHRLIRTPRTVSRKFSLRFYFELLINLLSPLPFVLKRYRSKHMQEAIKSELSAGEYDVVVADFLVTSVNFKKRPDVTWILFQHNVETLIWQRHFEVEKNKLKKLYFYIQWKKMFAYERAACNKFDAVIAVSQLERDIMRDAFGSTRVYDVATGVNTNYFQPSGCETVQPRNLVFTGSMDYLPNDDGIHYFIEHILPAVKRALPDITLTVVGRNPHPGLVALSKSDPSITVTGRVDDVRPYIERASAYIVPLRIGGGTRLKIYEAMAMGQCIVSTTIGAEGLPVRHGKEILLADSPEDFADSIIKVLTDEQLALDLKMAAAALVRAHFGWDRIADYFAEICQRVHLATSAGEASVEPGTVLIGRGTMVSEDGILLHLQSQQNKNTLIG